MKPTKKQIVDSSLFFYGGLTTLILTTIALFNLKNTTSVITLILFLPVTIYFLVALTNKAIALFHKFINADREQSPYFNNFSLVTFVNQPEISFSINLFLLSLSLSVILFKISFNIIK